MNTDDIEKAINLARGLLPIPVIGDALDQKIKEFIHRIADQKDLYLPYVDKGLGSEFLEELEFKDKELDPGYIRYKLIGLSDWLWIPITPVKRVNPFVIVPEPVVEFIVKKSSKSPGLMFMEPKLVLKDLPGMVFDISFERDISKPLITGIIKERNGKRSAEKTFDVYKTLYEGEERLKEVREMMQTMTSDDEYFRHSSKEFQLVWSKKAKKELAADTG